MAHNFGRLLDNLRFWFMLNMIIVGIVTTFGAIHERYYSDSAKTQLSSSDSMLWNK